MAKTDDGCSQQYEECCETKIGVLTVPKITCGMIFSDFYCAKPGYTPCAEAAFEEYVTCTKTKDETICYSTLIGKVDTCKKQALSPDAEEKAECPACAASGMEPYDGYKESFPEATPPFTETRCVYKKLNASGDSIGEGVIQIIAYNTESDAATSFYEDVEVSRDRMDTYENNKPFPTAAAITRLWDSICWGSIRSG